MQEASKNLLVIGPGQLGARVATLWQQKFPNAMIALKANRQEPNREAKWQSLGFMPHQGGHKYPNVLFSAPPAGDPEAYANAIETAISAHCANPESRFVFTSSGGVYTEDSGRIVDEESDVVSSEGTSRSSQEDRRPNLRGIVKAEKSVLEHLGGICLRLGGLYTLNRGAHNFWLSGKVRESPSSPNGLINLIHYDDAAKAVVLAFEDGVNSQEVFLVSDGQPLTRKQICEAALKNPLFRGRTPTLFKGPEVKMDGKRYNVAKVRSQLLWKPNFTDFSSFMEETFVQEMKVPLLDYKTNENSTL